LRRRAISQPATPETISAPVAGSGTEYVGTGVTAKDEVAVASRAQPAIKRTDNFGTMGSRGIVLADVRS